MFDTFFNKKIKSHIRLKQYPQKCHHGQVDVYVYFKTNMICQKENQNITFELFLIVRVGYIFGFQIEKEN